ncbi:MAG: CRISPR-associated helicase Cas3' [Pseudomonadota bacterium]
MKKRKNGNYIAHTRKIDKKDQLLEVHLQEVGEITSKLSMKLGTSKIGQLIGLLHDFGKYSKLFQCYIKSATGKLNPDEDEEDYVDFKKLKGKIDHSSAGAQWLWQVCKQRNAGEQLVGQILSLCIASHHSGLIDCLKPDGKNSFFKRMKKVEEDTHLKECIENAPEHYLKKIEKLTNKQLMSDVLQELEQVVKNEKHELIRCFNLGFWTKILFSCLIDADRINSSDFELPDNTSHRNNQSIDWSIPVNRLEQAIKEFKGEKDIDKLRRDISNTCKQRAKEIQGIYTLTVPTGGGKTYASLRYALNHAAHHKLDRIIYIIPFTSIIEQNAQALREVLECSKDKFPWILEQHSNLEPEKQNWHSKLVSENWDAPIVMTTMVQFLEVLFSGGTRSVRKMHQLANSVLIFDEIQTLPINCVHLFCNSLNFLTNYTKTTAVLCTATQPLLDQLKSPKKGQLSIPTENELIRDVSQLFKNLERVKLSNKVRIEGWNVKQIAELAINEFNDLGSCLIIVNTKDWAKRLYQEACLSIDENSIFQLSTNLCPAHRKAIFKEVKERLEKGLPLLCISTQLIEAGVDVDFASVIRFLAGLDSIAQAAGRCNRNGLLETATIHVINPDNESIDLLSDIREGIKATKRVLSEGFENMFSPEAMNQYFNYYFYNRAKEMDYKIPKKQSERDDTLLNLLSNNPLNIGKNSQPAYLLKQSFMSAGKIFKAIDSPTKAIIVPYNDEAKDVISELCRVAKEFDVKTYRMLLAQAQQFSVNVFPNVWKRLPEGAIYEIQEGEGIYYLDEKYYSKDFGLSEKVCEQMTFAMV